MDISIEKGRIVEKVNSQRVNVIDASDMFVMPGGVDIHSHIAGPEVNTGRMLRPEDHIKDIESKTQKTRSGVGRSIPSTFTTGYRYTNMGYTMVCNPSMAPLEARHTHEELNDTPIIDKASFPLLGDWWLTLEYLRNRSLEEFSEVIAWMILATKGYAIKIVNPGGVESWGFGGNVYNLDDPVANFDITPREIIRGLCRINQILNLPHTIHVHTNRLGKPGNYLTTLETMDCVRDLALGDTPNIHITHCQFSAFKGNSWLNMKSGAEEVAKYVNSHSHVSIDMGQIAFCDTTTMTADGPWQYTLHKLSNNKWINHDVETETGGGIVPYKYSRKNYVHSTMWSIGLELALLIRDPWKIFLTSDHPNGAPFTEYPRIISWLMSFKARQKTLDRTNKKYKRSPLLSNIDREYDLFEIAAITRAGPAKSLGLTTKGHLGIGGDADIAIYNAKPEDIETSDNYDLVRRTFARTAYTIKGGEIVSRDNTIMKVVDGKTYWVDLRGLSYFKENYGKTVLKDLRNNFRKYWTIEFENYLIPENYLHSSFPIKVEKEVKPQR